MPNRLAAESSPYLRQHAGNPVDWYPWGQEAFERAAREEKPIFLSVGYSTCHWCHVMEHESFEDGRIAALLNDAFVAIKVDREERPDVDRVYMTFVQATTGQGGWPMSVWLTPDLQPFYGGTYYPPSSQWGRPGFGDVLTRLRACGGRNARASIASADDDRRGCGPRRAAAARDGTAGEDRASPVQRPSTRARRQYVQAFDQQWGGFGDRAEVPAPVGTAVPAARARGHR